MEGIGRRTRGLSSAFVVMVVGGSLVGSWAGAAQGQDKRTKAGLLIDQVLVTSKDAVCQGRDSLMILGKALSAPTAPTVVTFGDYTDTKGLTLCSVEADGSKVVAALPVPLTELPPGGYLVEVYTGAAPAEYDAFPLSLAEATAGGISQLVELIGPPGATGPTGPPGATGPAGASVRFAGGWNDTTTYTIGHIVNFGASTYISLVNNNVNHQPPSAEWRVLTT